MPATRRNLFDPRIVRRAAVDALRKLNPRAMAKNPVMFIVEVGSVMTTILLLAGKGHFRFNLQITLWLWFTVLFANFAEAMAEGRGKAQADALRQAKSETTAYQLIKAARSKEVPSSQLRAGDFVRVVAGQMIPGDGEVIGRRRLGRRIRHHRRIRPRYPRGRRRPLRRHRRHPRPLGRHHGQASPPTPAKPLSTA